MPSGWLQSCSLPGLGCPKKTKIRRKRNVNFQTAINEIRELWVPVKPSTWAPGSGWGSPVGPSTPE